MRRELFEQAARKQAVRSARLIGRTNAARFRWLVKFANTENFDRITPSRFKRVQQEITAFAGLRASFHQSLENPISREAVHRIALFIRDGLRAYTNGASWDLPSMSIARSVIPNSDHPCYGALWNDAFLMSAADLVEALGALLRVCAATDCDALFVRHKRMIFCSSRCSGRERMRRFQADINYYKGKRREYYLNSLNRGRHTAGKGENR
jgi:hypothetical protein